MARDFTYIDDIVEGVIRVLDKPPSGNADWSGDVQSTYADITELDTAVGFKPATPLAEGIGKFVDWYREYYS